MQTDNKNIKLGEIKFGKYTIVFDDNIRNILKEFEQKSWKTHKEAGGILLGEVYDDEIRVLKASVPTRYDNRSFFQFIRQKDVAQILIDYEFYNSGGTIIYLGEWHTHAQKNPSPSFQDIRMLRNQFLSNDLNESFILLLIKGLEDSYIALYNGKELHEGYILL